MPEQRVKAALLKRLNAARVRKALKGLLAVAETAMPDTYFATDRRVRFAQQVLKELP